MLKAHRKYKENVTISVKTTYEWWDTLLLWNFEKEILENNNCLLQDRKEGQCIFIDWLASERKEGHEMDRFEKYLTKELTEEQRKILGPLFQRILIEFPNLETRISWNQPMFTDHGTFILGISSSKKHFSISPEVKTMTEFRSRIEQSGYSQTKNIFRILWDQPVDEKLIFDIIRYNIEDKIDYQKFWR